MLSIPIHLANWPCVTHTSATASLLLTSKVCNHGDQSLIATNKEIGGQLVLVELCVRAWYGASRIIIGLYTTQLSGLTKRTYGSPRTYGAGC